ncbi:MAG: hypothetical protein JJU12_01080 [Chlamydiales bacterium]|nr:hypothetical protein [Chlamydiales bacterium]
MSNVESERESAVLKAGSYSVVFLPNKGMNFISLKKGEIEVLDQATRELFEARYAGLGAMIGPHFHQRKVIPPIRDKEHFPHLAKVKGNDPFSHGIGRYAPWNVEFSSENQIRAVLKGEDKWQGITLKELEGQDFNMQYEATLTDEGLEINLSVCGETESLVGLHTYYALANGMGRVKARVRDEYNDQGRVQAIPSTWNYGEDHMLLFPLTEPADYGFRPYPDPLHGMMELETETHAVRVLYWCDNEENSIQLWHPEGGSFVCMEPLSAKDPRKPRLTVSSLKILISVL